MASSHATPTVSRARRSSGWTSVPPNSAIDWSPRSGGPARRADGSVADASHSAPKMMWIRDHEPRYGRHDDAGARRIVCVAPPTGSRSGRRERVVHDGVRRHPRRFDGTVFAADLIRPYALGLAGRPKWSARCCPRLRSSVSASCAVVVGTGDEHAASVGAGAIEPGFVVDLPAPPNRHDGNRGTGATRLFPRRTAMPCPVHG
jgi:hypothetical protein